MIRIPYLLFWRWLKTIIHSGMVTIIDCNIICRKIITSYLFYFFVWHCHQYDFNSRNSVSCLHRFAFSFYCSNHKVFGYKKPIKPWCINNLRPMNINLFIVHLCHIKDTKVDCLGSICCESHCLRTVPNNFILTALFYGQES